MKVTIGTKGIQRIRSGWKTLLLAVATFASTTRLAPSAAPVTAAAIAPDGQHVLLGSQAGIVLRAWPSLAVEKKWGTLLLHVHDLAFSPDGKYLLAAGGSPGEEGIVELWHWPEQRRLQTYHDHNDVVYRVAWSRWGDHWVSASADGVCLIHEHPSGRKSCRYDGHVGAVLSVAFMPERKRAGQSNTPPPRLEVLSAGADQSLRWWDARSGHSLRTLDQHVKAINDLAIRPDHPDRPLHWVATASEDGTARFWQPTTGRLVRFARLPSRPRALVWDHAGNRLFVGCTDGHVCLLDAETANVVAEKKALPGRIHALARDPHSDRLLIVGDGPPIIQDW